MANGVGGIVGVQAFRATQFPYAEPRQMQGDAVDPKHSATGEVAQPYPWQEFAGKIGPFGPEIGLLADEPPSQTLTAGDMSQAPTLDHTPYRTHAGPHIRKPKLDDRQPDGNADYLMASYEAHATRTNAAENAKASSNPLQDHYTGFFETIPGEDQVTGAGSQVSPAAFGIGVNDHTSNVFAKRNEYGIHASHRHRRYATGSVPGNYMWMKPGGRPLSKTLAGPARPAIGVGPFEGDDPMATFGINGAILQDNATEYVSPPQPFVVPAVEATADEGSPPIALY